jgi:hypothetical protein
MSQWQLQAIVMNTKRIEPDFCRRLVSMQKAKM